MEAYCVGALRLSCSTAHELYACSGFTHTTMRPLSPTWQSTPLAANETKLPSRLISCLLKTTAGLLPMGPCALWFN